MFFGIGKKDEKSNLWSDILTTLVIAQFIFTLSQKGFLRIPLLLSVLVISLICLMILQWKLLGDFLRIAAVFFFILELFLIGVPYGGGLLLLAIVIFFARLFIPAIFSIFGK